MNDMTVKQGSNRFYIGDAEADATAEIVFEPAGDGRIAATRTFVADVWRGQGVAGKLLDTLVTHARTEHLRIVPKCSYVEKKFADHPDVYADVIAD